jgi:hypothetical protein
LNPAAKVANSAIQKYNPEPPLYEMAGWMYEMERRMGIGNKIPLWLFGFLY